MIMGLVVRGLKWKVREADRGSVLMSDIKIGFISRLESDDVVAKDLLTSFDDSQGKRGSVEEGNTCREEYEGWGVVR